jgi:hypothetical protein
VLHCRNMWDESVFYNLKWVSQRDFSAAVADMYYGGVNYRHLQPTLSNYGVEYHGLCINEDIVVSVILSS